MVGTMSDEVIQAGATEDPPLDPDEVLFYRLSEALTDYSERQSEILRLAEFMDERAAEIDNAKQRAKRFIQAEMGSVADIDESAINDLITLFERMESVDEQTHDDLSVEERQAALSAALDEIYASLPDGHLHTYIKSVSRAMHAPPGAGVLRSSLLVSLVGELEVLVTQCARAGFERQPSALDDSGKSFTWSDIRKYDSIEDVRDTVVDRAIEDVLRGSLTEWLDYFVRRFSIAPIPVAKQYPAQENIQRRHCIVHNGGLVSSQYLDRLSAFNPDVQLNEPLTVDGDYLRRAADTLYLVGFSLLWSLAFKLVKEADARKAIASQFANRTYYLLQEGRYSIVKLIGRNAPLDHLEEDAALVMRVNLWLAHKLSGSFGEVRAEVEAMNVASKSRLFNLAKHALLDENEDAYRVAQSMIRDGELRPEFFYTWPLLYGVRDWERKKSESDGVAPDRSDR